MTDVLNKWVIEPVEEVPSPRTGRPQGFLKEEMKAILDTLKANPNRPFRVYVADSSTKINGRYGTMRSIAKRHDLNLELATRKEGEELYSLYASLVEGERL